MARLRTLQRYAARPVRAVRVGEQCELCAEPLAEAHRHLVDIEGRALCCACPACALLFERPEASGLRYRTVPDRVLLDPAGPVDEKSWQSISIPVQLAFVFFNSVQARWVAFYPSPAGATESELPLDGMNRLAAASRLVRSLEPDVEALLVRGDRTGRIRTCLLVPIDACYALVGIVRRSWRGFDGGDEVRRELDAFFERLQARSRPLPPEGGQGP